MLNCLLFFFTFVTLVSTQCNNEQFKCRDASCVAKTSQCNGLPDCKDWSDETLTSCRGVYRPIWNLVVVCSNERLRQLLDDVCPPSCAANPVDCGIHLLAWSVQRPPTTGVNSPCSYPTSVAHGKVTVIGEMDVVNKTASHGSSLRFSCNKKYDLVGKTKVYCQFGSWSEEFPTCVRSNRDRCILPPHPRHGQYIIPSIDEIRPGDHYENVNLYFSCSDGYRVLGEKTVSCNQGVWSGELPTCQKLCKLNPHVSVEYSCDIVVKNITYGSRPCELYEPEGAVVRPKCRSPNYYHSGMLNFMHCVDGNWDYVAVCDPQCGIVTPDGVQLEIGGRNAQLGELPWHAGVYDLVRFGRPTQICGGSLVSTTMVISAAHCFWNETTMVLSPPSNFAIALGKIYRLWNDKRDPYPQKFNVREIKVTERYRGAETLLQEDIALVLLQRAAAYVNNVRPVCLDFDVNFERGQLRDGRKGKIAGWGLTTENKNSEARILQVLELPTVSIASCITHTPVVYRPYITADKFCAGYWNASMALCMGDSGGGLSFAEHERTTERYYLRGVASTAPTSATTECRADTISTFTQISHHEAFIKQYLLL